MWIVVVLLCVILGSLILFKRQSFYAPPRDASTMLPFIDPSSNAVETYTQSNVFQDMGGFENTRENPMTQYFQGDLFNNLKITGDSCVDPILSPFANTTANTLIYGYSSECRYPFIEPSGNVITYTQSDVYNDTAAYPNKFEYPLSNVSSSSKGFVGLESTAGNAPMTVIPVEEQYPYTHPFMTTTETTNPSLTSYSIPFIGATL